MKIETYLNAIIDARGIYVAGHGREPKRARQYCAFRDRLIRIDERNKMRIAFLEAEIEQMIEDENKPSDIWGGLL